MFRQRMTVGELAWLKGETRIRPLHVATLLIFEVPDDPPPQYMRDMVQSLRASTDIADPFNRRILNPSLLPFMPFWVKDFDLDMEYHIRHQALPAPGGERELGGLIARLQSNPLDFYRPLWEFHIIEGLEDNRFAIYFKMHHAIVDGVSGVRMLERTMDRTPDNPDTPPIWVEGKKSGNSGPQNHELQDSKKPSKSAARFSTITHAGKGLANVMAAILDEDDPYTLPFQAPMSIFNHRVHSQRRFATHLIEFERIRRLAKLSNCTVNDAVLALCSGAIRRFLSDLCSLPGRSLTAGIPVSLRAADDQGSGVAVSFIVADLGTNIADPLRRLKNITDSTKRAKQAISGMDKSAIELLNNALLSPMLLQAALGLEGRTKPGFNLIISNVPGPKDVLYFRGARLAAMYPVSQVSHGQALNITCYSYAGNMAFGFSACRDTLPRMQRLAVYTGEVLEELERAVDKEAAS